MAHWNPNPPPHKSFKKTELIKYSLVSQFVYQANESPILHQTSARVKPNLIFSKTYQKKFDYLKKCLLKYRKITGQGRGIAAVQVGIPEAFALIYTPKKLFLIINPKIISNSKAKLIYPEMCMSTVPVIAPVARAAWIKFEYLDQKGQKQIWDKKDNTELNKVLNRVFQHEIDHMNGIINIEFVKNTQNLIWHSDPKFYKNAKFVKVN